MNDENKRPTIDELEKILASDEPLKIQLQPDGSIKAVPFPKFSVGDVIRMKHYPTAGGFRVWKIIACRLGAVGQEGTYGLQPLDVREHAPVEVPCIMLETHQAIEKV